MLSDDGRTDDRVTGILIAHLGDFGLDELKMHICNCLIKTITYQKFYEKVTSHRPKILAENIVFIQISKGKNSFTHCQICL